MSSEKFVKFVTEKLGITKTNPTVKELFQNKLGLADNVSSKYGIGAYAEEDLGSMIRFSSKKANTETIDVEKFLKNYYNEKIAEDGLVNVGKSQDYLSDVSKAYNTTKLIDEGALPIQIKNNILGETLDVSRTPKLVSRIEPYLDKDKAEILNTISLGLGPKQKSYKNVLKNVIEEKFPSNNFFSSLKKFEETYPTERLKTDFILQNQKQIDDLVVAYGLTPKSTDFLATQAQRIKVKFPLEQRRALMMSQAGKTLSKVLSGETEPFKRTYLKERKNLIYGFAPDTVNLLYRIGPSKLFEARFRNLLEGKKMEGYNQNLEKILAPVSGFVYQHRTPIAAVKAFKKYGFPNEVIDSIGLKNLMVLSNPSNRVLLKYETHANNLIKQAIKDDMKLKKINFKNQFGYASSKELDEISKLNENLFQIKNKINEIKVNLPEDLQLAFNPINVDLNKGIRFKPVQKNINDFVGYNLAEAKANGLVKGLHRLGVSKTNIKKAYDKAYFEVLKEIKSNKFSNITEETKLAPFEQISYKFNKGGIVNLKYGNKFIRFK